MTKGTFVFVLGMFLIVLPYLGLPSAWKQFIYVGLGILLLMIGYAIRRAQYFHEIDLGNGERGGDTFVETTQNLFANVKAE
jgi:hypothetical protein